MSCSDTNDMITNMGTKHPSTSQETCLSQMSQVILQPGMCQLFLRQCLLAELICFLKHEFQKGLITFLLPIMLLKSEAICAFVFSLQRISKRSHASTMIHCKDVQNQKYFYHKDVDIMKGLTLTTLHWSTQLHCFSVCVYLTHRYKIQYSVTGRF